MNNLEIKKFTIYPSQIRSTFQNISSFNNETTKIFIKTINYIFGVDLNILLKNPSSKKFSPIMNYILICLENSNRYNDPNWFKDRLFNSHDYYEFISLINNLENSTITNEIKELLLQINLGNENLLLNASKIYYIALNIFFPRSIGIPFNLNNIHFRNIINESFEKITRNCNLQEKLDIFISSLTNLFENSLSVIFHESFSSESQMILNGLMTVLNLWNVDVEKTSLFEILSNDITIENQSSYYFLFAEIINAYNLSIQNSDYNNIFKSKVPNLKNNKFLNLKLLNKLNKIPFFKKLSKKLTFNIDLALLNHTQLEFSEKFKILQSEYFDKKSLEEITNESNFYYYFISLFYETNMTQEELIKLIKYFIQFYTAEIFISFYATGQNHISECSNFIKKAFFSFEDEELKDIVSTALSHYGYQKDIAKFINDFNLFSSEERINFLFSSKTKTIEDFLLNYSNAITIDPKISFFIFNKFIALFEDKKISAVIIYYIFDWLDSHQDILLSENLIDEFTKLLLTKFKLNALSLIPHKMFKNSFFCLKIHDHLKSIGVEEFNNLTIPEIIHLLQNYTNNDLLFISSTFDLLPNELKCQIGSLLPSDDIKSLTLTSKSNLEIFNEEYYSKINNEIFKNIFFQLFPEYNQNINKNFPNNNFDFNKFDINNEVRVIVDNIYKKLKSNIILNLSDQIDCLNIFQYMILNGTFHDLKKSSFWNLIPLDEISSFYHVNKTLFNIIEQVFDLKERINKIYFYPDYNIETFILFLNTINVKLPSKIIDKIINDHSSSISAFFIRFYNNPFQINNYVEYFKNSNFINFSFLEKLILKKIIHCDVLFRIFFKGTKKHLQLSFLNPFLENSLSNIKNILLGDFPNCLKRRLHYIKTLSKKHNFLKEYCDEVVNFLSFNGYGWIMINLEFFLENQPLWILKNAFNNKYGLAIHKLSDDKKQSFISKSAELFGYSSFLHTFICASKLKISQEKIFEYAIHSNTNFSEFYSSFKNINKHKRLNINFDSITRFLLVFCQNKTPRNTSYQKHLDLIYTLINLEDNQCLELLKIIIDTIGLSSLRILSKSLIFQRCKILDKEFMTSIIKNRLTDKIEKSNFKKHYKILVDLIGKENAENLMNEISLKRKTRPQKISNIPQAKRRK